MLPALDAEATSFPRKAMSHSRTARPASARSKPQKGTMDRKDKSYLLLETPSPGPRVPPGTNSGDIFPCAPSPGCESFPKSLSPALARSHSTPSRARGRRQSSGSLTCGELALGRSQERPRGEEQECHKSRQRRRRCIHVDFGRSFKQLCKELPRGSQRNPRLR